MTGSRIDRGQDPQHGTSGAGGSASPHLSPEFANDTNGAGDDDPHEHPGGRATDFGQTCRSSQPGDRVLVEPAEHLGRAGARLPDQARDHRPHQLGLALSACALAYLARNAPAPIVVLKDADPAEMIAAIKAAHRGDPALSPAVAGTVIRAATTAAGTDPAAVRMVDELTERERQVAELLLAGRTNAEIGRQLALGLATVKAHITRIFNKLGVDNRVSAAMVLRDAGW